MANKITGSTDTSGALTANSNANKSVIIVAPVSGDVTNTVEEKTVFTITGTADALATFGSTSIVPQMVRVLVANSATNIRGIIVPKDGDTALADTLSATLADKSVKVVLLTNNDSDTISAVKDHLAVAEANDMFRYSVFAPSDCTTQSAMTDFAKSIDDSRIFVAGQTLLQGGTGVDPTITATGLASLIMTETDDPALPMNGVTIAGFDGISRTLLETEMNALVNGGVTPIYDDGSTAPTVWRLVTSSDIKGTEKETWQEGTTRFIADHVLETVENTLRAKYKRTKGVARILGAIKTDVDIVLKKLESLEIIENYDDSTLTVIKDPKDRYGALVDYEFDVVTPLYTITIKQHMVL